MLSFLELKIPPVIVVFIAALAMYFSPNPIVYFSLDPMLAYYTTRVLFVVSALVIVLGIYCFRKANTTVDPVNPKNASQLVNFGIYKYTRNPMYLGFAIMLLAMAVKMQSLVAFLWLAVFIWFMSRFQIKPEERALTKVFGEAYIEYCQQVRRWL